MTKLKNFRGNFRAGKYLLLSIPLYRKHIGDDRRAFAKLFWIAIILVSVFAGIALFSEVTGATLLTHILLILLAIVPTGHLAQQLVAYQATSPKHLLLSAFSVGNQHYKINRSNGLNLVTDKQGKKISLQDFSDLELFFASISSFTQLAPNIQNGLSIKNSLPIAYESGFLPNVHYASAQYGTTKNRSTFIIAPLPELLPYLHEIWDHGHIRKMSEKDASRLKADYKKLHTNNTFALAAAYLPHDHTVDGSKLDAATIKEHGIFVGLAGLKTKRDAKMFAADAIHNIRVGSRSTLAFAVSLLSIITVSFIMSIYNTWPPLLSVALIILIKFALEPLPAMSVVWDGMFKRARSKLEPHQSRSHSLVDGFVSAVVALIAYMSVFYAYGFVPSQAAAGSVLHARAVSVLFIVLIGCYMVTVLSQRHSSGIFNARQLHNRIFGVGLSAAMLVVFLVVYTGSISSFGVTGLPYQDLVFSFIAVGSFALISELRRHAENKYSKEKISTLLTNR